MLIPRFSIEPKPAGPAVQWDETPCPLCGHADAELVLEAQDPTPTQGNGLFFGVAKCRHCNLRYTNPRPDPQTIGRFYPTDYKPHRRPRKLRQAVRYTLWDRLVGRSCPERRGELPWDGPPGRLLDFGCGGGSFLRRMADKGWAVTGLDASVGAVREVEDGLGLNALVGSLPHPALEPGSFDVVTMWHSLEHVHDPLTILREAFRLLVPGGKLIVACPNIDGWAYHWFGPHWFGLDLPRHLVHFTPATLADALQASGFLVERHRAIRHSDWLRSSARLANAARALPWWQRPLLAKPVAKAVAWLSYVCGGSDCMVAVGRRPTA